MILCKAFNTVEIITFFFKKCMSTSKYNLFFERITIVDGNLFSFWEILSNIPKSSFTATKSDQKKKVAKLKCLLNLFIRITIYAVFNLSSLFLPLHYQNIELVVLWMLVRFSSFIDAKTHFSSQENKEICLNSVIDEWKCFLFNDDGKGSIHGKASHCKLKSLKCLTHTRTSARTHARTLIVLIQRSVFTVHPSFECSSRWLRAWILCVFHIEFRLPIRWWFASKI